MSVGTSISLVTSRTYAIRAFFGVALEAPIGRRRRWPSDSGVSDMGIETVMYHDKGGLVGYVKKDPTTEMMDQVGNNRSRPSSARMRRSPNCER